MSQKNQTTWLKQILLLDKRLLNFGLQEELKGEKQWNWSHEHKCNVVYAGIIESMPTCN